MAGNHAEEQKGSETEGKLPVGHSSPFGYDGNSFIVNGWMAKLSQCGQCNMLGKQLLWESMHRAH